MEYIYKKFNIHPGSFFKKEIEIDESVFIKYLYKVFDKPLQMNISIEGTNNKLMNEFYQTPKYAILLPYAEKD
ncbi:MAG: hypothetical protein JSU03_13020 [Bacteroidetes bacterium]|nr:hypothetical protein [Bacteroidota bacterium]MBS1758189.1 hypothetical protein [Bacteroidota bacterium]